VNNISKQLELSALAVPEILLPAKSNDIKTWSVVACDQFTQNRDFWSKLEKSIAKAPSTLNLIFPEVYLEDGDKEERIKNIHETMRQYLFDERETVFSKPWRAGVFVKRATHSGTRLGMVALIDLEKYDWNTGAKTMIRPSERTIEERLPVRMEIRRNAPLELPHIILLIDDENNMLFPLLEKLTRGQECIYNCGLQSGGGSIQGHLLCRNTDWSLIAGFFTYFYRQAVTKYGEEDAFLFAVGDGNHSLASAKAVWEEYKKAHSEDQDLMEHPARWAMVEIENVHDGAIAFEPIHRLLLGVKRENLINALKKLPDAVCKEVQNQEAALALVNEKDSGGNRYGLITKDQTFVFETSDVKTATVALDPLLAEALEQSAGGKIDYVHEWKALLEAVNKNEAEDASGILLPPFNRYTLFKTISESGPLPRKSFSMGAALEKRYYLEARRLFAV
jgi:hypothetical protein